MRELNSSELNEVSGAGFIADAGTALGRGIGAIIEAAGGKGGMEAGTSLGTGIGQVVEAGLGVLSSIVGGLFGSIFGRK
ncbi:hypothetical protein RJ492_003257 [Pluralibacter gergoviae]|uniref:Uncharacterized protein n=1 Tax=Pluralibacter gergoviae TaxID=61647 RepID=A0AAI9GJV5_PLUGE|nr:hypothetical protein [Pluralibacter gergoviae]EKV0913807.1 hypothetical protein [Pluralibacter gergoviae]EKV9906639.1 hypothetical protein [Pluralibacter gergoviae]EKW7272146.1 hypothetical protein [Pluralibacter gergoviae]ELD4294581.1 hypothetical protein [Pluralibacter gergoviae]ELD4305360.1 hypothetical protein [Pluralibacter gergoviae]